MTPKSSIPPKLSVHTHTPQADGITFTTLPKTGIPPGESARKKETEHVQCNVSPFLKDGDFESCDRHLVDGKTDGEEPGPLLTLHPPALLHQSHHQGAGLLPAL